MTLRNSAAKSQNAVLGYGRLFTMLTRLHTAPLYQLYRIRHLHNSKHSHAFQDRLGSLWSTTMQALHHDPRRQWQKRVRRLAGTSLLWSHGTLIFHQFRPCSPRRRKRCQSIQGGDRRDKLSHPRHRSSAAWRKSRSCGPCSRCRESDASNCIYRLFDLCCGRN